MIWAIGGIAVFCIMASVLPFLPIPHGMIRAFDFPRLQVAILSFLALLAALAMLELDIYSTIVILLLVVSLGLQLTKIVRFSRLGKRIVPQYKGGGENISKIKLLVSNVKMGNRDYDKLINLIEEKDPDIALLIEVDAKWCEALGPTIEKFEHRLLCPKETSYGLLLLSKYPMVNKQINYLLKSEVPSFDILFQHDSGETFRLIALHPEPPVPSKYTVGRDGELSLVAKNVRDYDKPIIVAGDLNDVAWSRTTRRFMRVSRLLDPREGRGMYNSFDARYFFIRWPLDHIFHSNHFEISQIKRLPSVGSDHFPMFYEVVLIHSNDAQSEIDEADRQDLQEAEEVVQQAEKDDDKAVGTDWEK
ncbi:endonuclease/exonuclease/phosphatase family protein [Ahrensia marina]|uniref:YD repeat-containing protein n=1 Tax=Ahrensia marina TaxID=1514904 RepID=A0A0N0E8Y7_9HYPH|nr:endonuclease/exonuclease/phosphatase family protein [Ahrensia marina]KPB02892.1 YD repeat-containing protein [Ahrensia marina]